MTKTENKKEKEKKTGVKKDDVTFSLLLPLKFTNSNKQNYKMDKEPDQIPSVPLRSSELSVHLKTSSTVILNV